MTTLCGVSHLRRSGIPFAYGTQPSRAGLTCVAPPALRKPVEEFVPEAGGGEEPGAAVVEAERGTGEGNCGEGIGGAGLRDGLRDFGAAGGRYGCSGAGGVVRGGHVAAVAAQGAEVACAVDAA